MPRYLLPVGITVAGFVFTLVVSSQALDGQPASVPTHKNKSTQAPQETATGDYADATVPTVQPSASASAASDETHSSAPSQQGSAAPTTEPARTSQPSSSTREEKPAAKTKNPKIVKTPEKHKATPKKPKKDQGLLPDGKEKSDIRKGLDKVVPGLEHLPSWALPIVYKAEEKAAPGTVVQARLDSRGRLVITGKVEVQEKKHHGFFLMSAPTTPKTSTVEVEMSFEDPTDASWWNPAEVEIKVTDPQTAETASRTGRITDPTEVEDVTTKTLDQAVEATGAETMDLRP